MSQENTGRAQIGSLAYRAQSKAEVNREMALRALEATSEEWERAYRREPPAERLQHVLVIPSEMVGEGVA